MEEEEHSAELHYEVTSKLGGEFDCGFLSLSGTLVEESRKRMQFAALPFTDTFTTDDMFTLFYASIPEVSEAFIAAGGSMLVKSFGCTFSYWLNKTYSIWHGKQRDDLKIDVSTWWTCINGSVVQLFRDITKGVRSLHKKRCCCRNLEQNVVVHLSSDGKGKVTHAEIINIDRPGDPDLGDRRLDDIRQIRDMMLIVLLMPFRTMDESYLSQLKLPKSMENFLGIIKTLGETEKEFTDWLLDEPLFWTAEEKSTFIRKLWFEITSSESSGGRSVFLSADSQLADLGDWERRIVKDSREGRVLTYMQEKEAEYVRDGGTLCRGPFAKTTGYYRHMLLHTTDQDTEFDKDQLVVISTIADSLIGNVGSLCSLLHRALFLARNQLPRIVTVTVMASLSTDWKF